MNRFNLTFRGEILPNQDPQQAKASFGKLFAIDDPVRLERFFSGQTIILRRNLERKSAAEYYARLRKLGMAVELVKVGEEDPDSTGDEAVQAAPESSTKPALAEKARRRGMDRDFTLRRPGQVDQSWAVPSTPPKPARSSAKSSSPEPRDRLPASRAQQADLQAVPDAAHRETLQAPAARQAEEAARLQARQEEARRKAAEEAARRKAEEQALIAARRAEEAARRKAEQEEKRRVQAEEAARKKLLREEASRQAAQRKSELAEQKRAQAEEAARQKAAQQAREQEAKRKAAAEAAQRQAELAEQKRAQAEEAARQKVAQQAREDEAKRKAAAEAAQRKAELAVQKRAQAEEAARQKAVQEARDQEAKRKAAEEAEQARLERAEKKRRQREEKAKREAERAETRRLQAEATAREQAIRDQARREEAAEAARRAAAAQRARDAEKARIKAVREEQAGQRRAMEEQAVSRAAEELARQPSLKPVQARLRSKLGLPQRKSGQATGDAPRKRPRRGGAANLFTLHPFRNTSEVRNRATQARAHMRRGFATGGIALACLLLLAGRYLSLPPAQILTGADAIAIAAQSGPLLLAGENLLPHDRAGLPEDSIAIRDLGAADLQAPMAFTASGELLISGRIRNGTEFPDGEGPSRALLRCNLQESSCRPFFSQPSDLAIAGLTVHHLSGDIFMADAKKGLLLMTDSKGEIAARVEAAVPPDPVLRLESGLLFMNSALGPAISVFRHDNSAFGQQLDEILLLPPPALKAGHSRVRDFIWSVDNWWALLENPSDGNVGLYRFDGQWNYLQRVQLRVGTRPRQLLNWGGKVLALDPGRVPIQRFSPAGLQEAPLVSTALQTLVSQQQRTASWWSLAWRVALLLCSLVALGGCCLGRLHHLRALVYKSHRERGAEPVDDLADSVLWLDPVADRPGTLRRTAISYAVLALAVLLICIGQHLPGHYLAAVLLALSGPAAAIALMYRSPTGHIGVAGGLVLLVDHRDMYHLGGDSHLQYRGPFVLIDDVLVFTGTRLLPAFSPSQVKEDLLPLASGGIMVDRKTVLVKLLECRHPLAIASLAIIAGLAAALTLVLLTAW